MGTAINLPPDTRPRPKLPVKRFSLAEYHHLIEIGFLKPSDKVELIDGWMVPKMPQNPPHNSTIRKLTRWFMAHCPEAWVVQIQGPVTLDGDSEPEPDLAVAIGPETRFSDRHPGPGEIVLVVEVADSSLDQDAGDKLEVYARNRIPQYWIVNLIESQIEVHTQPRGGVRPTYHSRVLFTPGETIPVALGRKAIGKLKVADALPGSK